MEKKWHLSSQNPNASLGDEIVSTRTIDCELRVVVMADVATEICMNYDRLLNYSFQTHVTYAL